MNNGMEEAESVCSPRPTVGRTVHTESTLSAAKPRLSELRYNSESTEWDTLEDTVSPLEKLKDFSMGEIAALPARQRHQSCPTSSLHRRLSSTYFSHGSPLSTAVSPQGPVHTASDSDSVVYFSPSDESAIRQEAVGDGKEDATKHGRNSTVSTLYNTIVEAETTRVERPMPVLGPL